MYDREHHFKAEEHGKDIEVMKQNHQYEIERMRQVSTFEINELRELYEKVNK